jgi:hypothetical protein
MPERVVLDCLGPIRLAPCWRRSPNGSAK